MSDLDFSYDQISDCLTIEGIRYSGNLFREWGKTAPLDTLFEIVSRENGCLTMRRPEEAHWKQRALAAEKKLAEWQVILDRYAEQDAKQDEYIGHLRSDAEALAKAADDIVYDFEQGGGVRQAMTLIKALDAYRAKEKGNEHGGRK